MLKISWMAVALVLLGGITATAQPPAELPGNVAEAVTGEETVVTPGDYWLGIQCFPVPTAMRMPLNVPEKQGLLVAAVVPESPAAKAGILRHDILLRAGERPLMGPGDLIQAIETVKEGKLEIELLRDGKTKTIEAAPEKRPEGIGRNVAPMPGPGDWETMEKWFEGAAWPDGETGGARPPLRFRVIHPGAIVPHDVLTSAPLPPNMSIVVHKQGDQPAQITVQRGEEKWETTEKDLDALPPDVRPHVERMLGRGPLGIVGDLPTFNFAPGSGTILPPSGSAAWESRFEKRLDEMNRRMDRLLNAIEQSMGGHMQQKVPEKSAEK